VLATTYLAPPKFLAAPVASGFRFNTIQDKRLHQAVDDKAPEQVVDELRTQIPPASHLPDRRSPGWPRHPPSGELTVDNVLAVGGLFQEEQPADPGQEPDRPSDAPRDRRGAARRHRARSRKSWSTALDDLSGAGVSVLRQRG
jgi:hypothetical protein